MHQKQSRCWQSLLLASFLPLAATAQIERPVSNPEITFTGKRSDRDLVLNINSPLVGDHFVECSVDLEHWEQIGTATNSPTGKKVFNDRGALDRSDFYFYRVVHHAEEENEFEIEPVPIGLDPDQLVGSPGGLVPNNPVVGVEGPQDPAGTGGRPSRAPEYPTAGISEAAGMGPGQFFLIHHGSLVERVRTGSSWAWIQHGRPDNVRFTILFAPGGMMDGDSVFAIDSHGRLWRHDLISETWIDHGRPDGKPIESGLSTIYKGRFLFVIRGGRLWEHDILTRTWKKHPRACTVGLWTAPLILNDYHIFCLGKNNKLYEYWLTNDGWQWVSHKNPGKDITAIGAPMHHRIFCAVEGGSLVERYWSAETGWQWHNHGKRGDRMGRPATLSEGTLHVKVNSPGGAEIHQLYWSPSAAKWVWYNHGNPAPLIGLWQLGTMPGSSLAILADSTVVERDWHHLDGWIWRDHGSPP